MNTQISGGLKITFLLHFVVALLFGLGFLLIPATMLSMYGLELSGPTIYRLFGGALLGFSVSSWLGYRATTWESVRIVVIMEIFWAFLGALIFAYGLLVDDFPALAWMNVAILAAFGIAFTWFYTRR